MPGFSRVAATATTVRTVWKVSVWLIIDESKMRPSRRRQAGNETGRQLEIERDRHRERVREKEVEGLS